MAEWTSKLLFGDSSKDSDLKNYVAQIQEENNEYMAFDGAPGSDTQRQKITFEQLAENRILHEVGVDLGVLKDMESMLADRMHAYTLYFNAMGKTHYTMGPEQSRIGGSLGLALDAMYVFIEQELQQSKQQTMLVDLKNTVIEQRNEGRKKFNDYQTELSLAERNIELAEKRLGKARDILEKVMEARKQGTVPPSTVGNKFTRALKSWGTPQAVEDTSPTTPSSKSVSPMNSVKVAMDPVTPTARHTVLADEALVKAKSEVRDSIRILLNLIETRDNLRIASRRAYYDLVVSSKQAIAETIKQVIAREREAVDARLESLNKLEAAAAKVDVVNDVDAFCDRFARDDDTLVLYSQALLLIGNISEEQKKGIASWNPVEPSPSDIATVVAAAHHSSGHITDASTSQFDLAVDAAEHPLGTGTSDLPAEFTDQVPDAILAAVTSQLPDPVLTQEAILSRIQAEDLKHSDATTAEAPKYAFKQKYTDEPGRALNAEAAYEMFHNIFYITDAPALSKEEVKDLSSARCPLSFENFGTKQCRQEVELLSVASETLAGRTILVLVLNQFRSKKVNVGAGWLALGKVLWKLLDNCKVENDVHNAKIVMMLSQTFFAEFPSVENGAEDDELKLYIKEILLDHDMWKEPRFWEQSLWQCVMEQLQTFRFGGAWYDLNGDERVEAVKRVHDVAFSQVMAIAHSMMELGCTKAQAREFIYRMCVLHQLSEPQRHMLLSHLVRHE